SFRVAGSQPSGRQQREVLMQAAKQLAQHVGVARACEALNVPRSSYYATYHPRPPKTKLRRPSHRKLTPEEERHVLAVLNSPRFRDMSPREMSRPERNGLSRNLGAVLKREGRFETRFPHLRCYRDAETQG